MILQYDEFADSLWVSLSEPSSPCVYMESQTAGVLLRIEEASGIVRGFEVIAWSRRIEKGIVLIPEIADTEFQAQWIRNLSLMRAKE